MDPLVLKDTPEVFNINGLFTLQNDSLEKVYHFVYTSLLFCYIIQFCTGGTKGLQILNRSKRFGNLLYFSGKSK